MGFIKGVAFSYMKWGRWLGWNRTGVNIFGKRVGFVKFNADVVDKATKKKVPGIVFARGPVVAVLILLELDGKTYAVLTEQGCFY
ncbi:hypothetical protein LOK49_LG07G01262 [Camellia lanceoleosa]|uniref:Uncharacterized protein n=1 Tax=Camellia lanceoleosa TaxID=1840588 RepID=A0ACC0H674_9ERIC|nr:hypothetical protein LOK49_LG07G01262 [Camellia lanceoleosa]